MRVKITKCCSDDYWYKYLIDCVFKVDEKLNHDYAVTVGNVSDVYCIKKTDCEILPDKPIKKLNWKKAKAEIEDYTDRIISPPLKGYKEQIINIINNNITEE